MLYIRIDVCHLCLAIIAKFCKLRTWRTSRKTLKRWWGRLEKRCLWPAGTATTCGGAATIGGETAGDETAATAGVMYADEGEFDEDEMAALEGQRLVAELFPDFGSEPDFEGFHVSEPAGNLSGRDDSGSEVVTESDDDEGVTGRLSAAATAAAYRTNPNLPDFVHSHGPLIHASGSFAYEISCSLFPDELRALLVEETNRYYGIITRLLLH